MGRSRKTTTARCEPWCRHYFRSGGSTFCAFGGGNTYTEKGAPCMGRRERTTKKKETKVKDKAAPPRKWKPPDNRCRKECVHFEGGACNYGPEPHAAEEGGPCLGEKFIPWKLRKRED